MVLSDVDIRRYLTEGKIKISPALPPDQYGSCSVDFRLGEEFSVFEHKPDALIDLRQKIAIQDLMRTITVAQGDPFILQPGEFALAITEETLETGRTTFWDASKAGRAWAASASSCMEPPGYSIRVGAGAQHSSSAIWA
jgi:deoxycytidine triphosphate deaminase